MLKVELLAVGTRPPEWVSEGIDHYTSRMKRDCRFEISEIKTADRKKNSNVSVYKEEESRSIKAAVNNSARVIAMDPTGKLWSTEQLAKKLEDWSQMTNHFQFIIGGPDGLAADCLADADEVWSLSKLTFPHFLVRVLLAEQIYRALMINANHPYHK